VKSFSISLNTSALTATKGGAGVTATLTLTMYNSYNSRVDFSATGQPSGLTVSFSPTYRTSAGTSTITFTAGSGTAVGTYPITIYGKGPSGTITKSTVINVNVQ
jgi:hypothetical protein